MSEEGLITARARPLSVPGKMECYVQVKKCSFTTVLPRDGPGARRGWRGGRRAPGTSRGNIVVKSANFFTCTYSILCTPMVAFASLSPKRDVTHY